MSRHKHRDSQDPSQGADLPDALTANGQCEEVGGGGSAPVLEQRRHLIEETAYYMAEQRGFTPGHEMEDWLEAERQINTDSRSLPMH